MAYLTVSLLFGAAVALGQVGGPDEVVVTKEVEKKDRKICESSYPTGSKLPKKVCRTASEWEHIRRESKLGLKQYLQDTEHLRQQSQAGPRTDGATIPR